MSSFTKPLGLLSGLAAVAISGAGAFAAEGPLVVNYSLPPPTLDPSIVCDISDDGFIASL